MKILKYVVIAIIVIIAIPLIVALFVSMDANYSKSIAIDAPVHVVWENVNSLADLDKWSPWNDKDPGMKKDWTGTDGTVGASQSWTSDVEGVGSGSQTISTIEAPNLLETDLIFYEPYESEAKAFVKLTSEGSRTVVTWGFESEMPYPFNIMGLFMDMGEMLDEDYNKGLGRLKQICEN